MLPRYFHETSQNTNLDSGRNHRNYTISLLENNELDKMIVLTHLNSGSGIVVILDGAICTGVGSKRK